MKRDGGYEAKTISLLYSFRLPPPALTAQNEITVDPGNQTKRCHRDLVPSDGGSTVTTKQQAVSFSYAVLRVASCTALAANNLFVLQYLSRGTDVRRDPSHPCTNLRPEGHKLSYIIGVGSFNQLGDSNICKFQLSEFQLFGSFNYLVRAWIVLSSSGPTVALPSTVPPGSCLLATASRGLLAPQASSSPA